MPRNTLLSFANLTCRFGQVFVMTDLLQEVILPAFFNEQLQRSYGESSYFFRNVGIIDVAAEGVEARQLTIYGRLIKDTVVSRSQVYSAEHGLVANEASLDSAPSAFFALDLNNHKLMYAPEVPGAPTMKTFATTLQSFARRQLETDIHAQHAALKITDQPKSFRQLREEFPRPDIKNADGTRSGDIPFAQREGVPSYLGTPSGQVLKYDPSTNSVQQLQPPTPQQPQ